MEDDSIFQEPVLEIPGLNWRKLTLKQARQHKSFMQQEFQRWLEDSDYLFELRMTHLIPAPVSEWEDSNPGAKVFITVGLWRNGLALPRNFSYSEGYGFESRRRPKFLPMKEWVKFLS